MFTYEAEISDDACQLQLWNGNGCAVQLRGMEADAVKGQPTMDNNDGAGAALPWRSAARHEIKNK